MEGFEFGDIIEDENEVEDDGEDFGEVETEEDEDDDSPDLPFDDGEDFW